MNDLQNSLLESMSILAKSASQSTPATLTVEAVIISVIDANTGLYLVEYLGNKFKAYADITSKYSSGELVYVLIPNGDFSKNKVILRAVTPTVKNYSEQSLESKFEYNNIGDNLFDYSGVVVANSFQNEIVLVEQNDINFKLEQLQNSLNKYLKQPGIYLQLKFDIQTKLIDRNYGNYGLILDIPTENDGIIRYVIDTRDMLGNPYNFINATPQSKVFFLDSIDLERKIKLYTFTEDFISGDVNVEYEPDIFFSNFSISVVELTSVINQSLTGYKLFLTATDGTFFLSKSDKTIIPKLYVNDNETALTNLECYWFEEDAMISYSSKEFLQEGGIGWRCVNKKKNITTNELGVQDIDYDLFEYFYSVPYSAFKDVYSKRFKCVIKYNNVLVSKIIEIKNYTDSAAFQMELLTANNTFSFLKGSDVELVCKLKNCIITNDDLIYIWHRYDSENNFVEKDFVQYLQQDIDTVKVSFSSSKINKINTIRCFIYKLDAETKNLKLLASDEVTVAIATDDQYFAIISPNNLLYKYDKDGDSPLIADYDGPSPLQGLEPLQLHIYKQNGSELTDSEYQKTNIVWTIPKNSLFKIDTFTKEDDDNYIVYGNTLSYMIADVFNKNYAQATIKIDIQIGDKILYLEPNIQFFKENESGLNGSKYTALIQYGGRAYNPLAEVRGHNLVAIKQITKEGIYWKCFSPNGTVIDFDTIRLGISVYKDNIILVNDEINHYYEVEWSLFDANGNSILCNNGILDINRNENILTDFNIIQAKITINNNKGTQQQKTPEIIYSYYPIDIISYEKEFSPDDILIPLMSGGFNFVTYSKDGINPKYDTTQKFKLSCNINNSNEIERFDSYSWKISNENVLSLNNHANTSAQTIIPINRYDQEVKNLMVSVTATPKLFMEELEKNPPNEQLKDQEILRYKTNKNCIVELLKYTDNFYKNIWMIQINKCVKLLAYRESIILELNKIINILNNMLIINPQDKQAKKYLLIAEDMLTNIYDFTDIDYNNYILDLQYQISEDSNKILAEELNQKIITYNLACNDLIKYSKTSEYGIARLAYLGTEGTEGIRNVNVKRIPTVPQSEDYLLDQYKYIRDKIDAIINGVKFQLNAASLLDHFANIPSILNYYGIIKNNEYNLNDSLENWFYNEIEKIEQNFQNNLIKYQCDIQQKNSSSPNANGNNNFSITISRPIAFLYDRDGLSTVQGWDGNKLYVSNGDNQEYLTSLSAAVGTQSQSQTYGLRAAPAGFSGIALGTHVTVDNVVNTELREQGLYGYYNGQQTFMLNASNGIASFGKPGGGQIILDPSSKDKGAILKSGDYLLSDSEGKGMEINLSKPSITFGNGNFTLNEEGYLTAKGVSISGKIIADSGEFNGSIHTKDACTFEGDITANNAIFKKNLNVQGTATIGSMRFRDGQIFILKNNVEETFIKEDGTVIISSVELGTINTAVNSNIGGWNVLSTGTSQLLKGGPLILEPNTSSIYYEGNELRTTFSSQLKNGFYLGKDGFTIPNVIKIEPTAQNNFWQLDSKNFSWSGENGLGLNLGFDGVNLLNTFKLEKRNNFLEVVLDTPILNMYSTQNIPIAIYADTGIILDNKESNIFEIQALASNINIRSKNLFINNGNLQFSIQENQESVIRAQYDSNNGISNAEIKTDNIYLGKKQDWNLVINPNGVLIPSSSSLNIEGSFKIGETTLTEKQLKALLALI